MPLDNQLAAVLQGFTAQGEPDYATLDAVQYRLHADNLMPPLPGADMAEVRDLQVARAAGLLPARLYRPVAREDLPLLVFFHGGGFVIGNLDTHDNLCRALALETRAVVVSVGYRLAPEARFPAAPEDCYAATCWLVEQADALGVDARRLAVAGDSAGGNLAIAVSRLARERQGPAIRHQCLFYPVTDAACDSASYRDFAEGYLLSRAMMGWFWAQYLERPEQGADPLASPLRDDDLQGLPATTLLTAEYDPLRDEGEAFAERLQAAGVAVRLQRCDGMVHGFVSLAPFVEAAARALQGAAADIRRALS
ncbi:alpha/beta hydrolase [Pseudomonas guariconensis]|uniref:alpha/beta hydrolase n=1 Tax=Pseudomonas guariconensis TaxID=1288410 RepID=UPI002D1F1869|nr:alpha/beta hydrolase [Pseudomonas guariconensis]MEB3842109.1 alpha/beta hydrolase [Pseudomonas guariconensis]MEB3874977.1 alpha/beta hydrolase [Pseudomonas guariconensis]MEB3880680.1 alpha/beta hydrolase [Pseudomonas guariconensis]MEB3897584.1 alpha/beta hydrolase [Pseudomonas guariconensis]